MADARYPGSAVMAYEPAQVIDGAQVTVVTGTQFTVNAPAQSAPGSTAATASTAPRASSTPASPGAIAEPTPTTSNLQQWDRCSCAPGAVPTAPSRTRSRDAARRWCNRPRADCANLATRESAKLAHQRSRELACELDRSSRHDTRRWGTCRQNRPVPNLHSRAPAVPLRSL